MSAAYASVVRSPRPSPRQALAWLVAITALFLAASYAVPAIPASGAPSVASRLAIHVAFALGLSFGLARTTLSRRERVRLFLALMIPSILWLSTVWSAAINGAFLPGPFPPVLPFAIVLPLLIFLPPLLASKRVGQLLDAMPASWLVGFQAYRVLGGAFLVLWLQGAVPGIFALPAGIGDVLTGLMALPVAYSLAAGDARSGRAALAWNIFGLIDFTIAVGIGFLAAPGPLQVIVPSTPNIALGSYPGVLIPAFAVPSSILLHALSLRQLRRRRRTSRAPAADAGASPMTQRPRAEAA